MHRPTVRVLLQQHLGRPTDVPGIKIVILLVGELDHTVGAPLLLTLIDNIRYLERLRKW